MAEPTRIPAPHVAHAAASRAADAGMPLSEANPHQPGTPQWHLFNNAYRQAVHCAECEAA